MGIVTAKSVVENVAESYLEATGESPSSLTFGNIAPKVKAAILNGGGGGGVEITDITLNSDGTYTVTDADENTHTLAVTETDGQITAITYDGNNVPLTFDSNGNLIGVGEADVDVSEYQGTILSGSNTPTAQTGDNGNIYLQYRDVQLPSNYSYCEYIEATGTQYIDTGVPARVQLRAEIDIQGTQNSPEDQTILGGSNNQNNNCIYLGFNFGPSWLSYYLGFNNSWTDIKNIIDLNRHNISVSYKSGDIVAKKDNTVVFLNTATLSTTTSSVNLHIFGRATGTQLARAKLYGLKIYDYLDNESLIRDFIPVINTTTNEAGLYDLVTETFYENKGTGTFGHGTQGSNIEHTILKALVKKNNAWIDLIGAEIEDVSI